MWKSAQHVLPVMEQHTTLCSCEPGRKHQGRVCRKRLIILVKKGWLSCRGWTPRRQEQTGRIRTKVSSILDNTSRLWGAGRLKTPLRCYTECFRLFFVSQPLHCSMLHVQMVPVLAHWEGIDRNTGLPSSAVTFLISINTLCRMVHVM